ncbi:cobalamin biosynthesis family protein [Vibrio brasiliensis]|jgi:adenosylcobinamide-phosphate synthase|uniref:Adenosylcobinamide-phosphate synthase n=1 Tax=Vibrio brasiliensis LMG 20546 TaxID=945543 RepID=E8LPN0_9VIBR|nr:cobalamin biosynthesis family protein [Vibrio brasiliensis]EGA67354.1 adenosylcobinamide-phosphate synthase [Vibrio brasiliensis LMG 20546]MCG9726254.1 cobalamin biosynthesis family protein [Vibrio brasiliensis]MCG9750592.1 cobalamin biosynthesis family protein [Vibrio brasiliensis]MCG9780815.1 cobalamin biosynthesis family protein [Vibrio brasiliensis]
MEDLFHQLYSNGALLVLWGALLCHLILPFPREAHPAILWHKFAEQLADKVNINSNYSQSVLSGSLAWLLMIAPMLVVLVALKPLVWQPQLFELAFLLLAIDWRNTDKFTAQFVAALAREDKEQAKMLIKPLINRSTAPLSLLGLGKAGSETLIMSYGRNVVGVLFWYAIGGGIGAFGYRMCVELARAWSPSREKYAPFGLAAVRAVALLDFIPLRLFALMVAIGHRVSASAQLIKQQAKSWPLPGPAWLLVAVGGKLELSLGGPAIYDGKKSVRAKLGGRIAPSAIHVAQVQKLLAWRMFAWIIIQSLLMGLIYQGI